MRERDGKCLARDPIADTVRVQGRSTNPEYRRREPVSGERLRSAGIRTTWLSLSLSLCHQRLATWPTDDRSRSRDRVDSETATFSTYDAEASACVDAITSNVWAHGSL